jgi:multidrug transporter EmrE-like cation transporter
MSDRIVLAVCAVAANVAAQVCLHTASRLAQFETRWWLWFGGAASCYVLSMVAYSRALRFFPISLIGPIVTAAVVVLIFGYGVLRGEAVSFKQLLGVALACAAIILLSK